MGLLTNIVLGSLIAIGIAVLVFIALVAFYIWRAAKAFADGSTSTPLAIHLHEDLAPDWLEHKKVKAKIDQFKSLGFTVGKAYTVEEMPQLKCLSLFHEKYVGVVYEVEKLGNFIDMLHMTSPSETLTITTMPFANAENPVPGKEKILLEDADVSGVYQVLSERTEGLPTIEINQENFRQTVEAYYKEEQSYRIRNGGMSFEEFNAMAAKLKMKKGEADMREAFIELKCGELRHWNYAALDDHFDDGKSSDEERYDCDKEYFFVPVKADAEGLVHYLNDYDIVLDDHVKKVGISVRGQDNAIELFERINNSRSPERRAVEHCSVSFPVEARLYYLKY